MSSRRQKFSLDQIEVPEDEVIPQKPLLSRPFVEPEPAPIPPTVEPVVAPVSEPVAVEAVQHSESPAVEIENQKGTVTAMSAIPAAPQPAVTVASKPQATQMANGNVDRIQLLAEQRFKPVAEKRQTSVRLEPWLDDALNERFLRMKLQGFRKITREAIIVDALIQYLGIIPPE